MSDETDIVNRLRQRATILPGVLPNTAWRGVCAEAADTIARLRAEVEALRGTFDLQWKADQRAIKRWQAAHPDKQHIWPGRTDLVVWLMEQHDDGALGLGERGG